MSAGAKLLAASYATDPALRKFLLAEANAAPLPPPQSVGLRLLDASQSADPKMRAFFTKQAGDALDRRLRANLQRR